MLPRYFIYSAEFISGAYRIRVRAQYSIGTYRIILISLTVQFGLPIRSDADGYGIRIRSTHTGLEIDIYLEIVLIAEIETIIFYYIVM
jgi:hypothetical protein